MQEQNITNNFTFYILLLISGFFLFIDFYEFSRILVEWKDALKMDKLLFEKCYQYKLIVNTLFSVFSTIASLSALTLTLLIVLNFNFFMEKLINTYLYFNFLVFGPYMLAFSVLGLIHSDKVLYTCDANMNKHFSNEIVFNLTGCMGFSIIVTLCVTLYCVVALYIKSITRGEGGSRILSRAIYWIFYRRAYAAS
jgi:hypothetical protein